MLNTAYQFLYPDWYHSKLEEETKSRQKSVMGAHSITLHYIVFLVMDNSCKN